MVQKFIPAPNSPAPSSSTPTVLWMRRNFLGSPLSILITALGLYLLWIVIPPVLDWSLIQASWVGTDRTACEANPDGACWVALRVRFWQVMLGLFYGSHPEEIWRPLVVFAMFIALAIPLLKDGLSNRRKLYVAAFTVLVFPLIGYALIHGKMLGLVVASTSQWGGFMLTLILAVGGIVMALPIGILLALGRRSGLPVIKWFCIIFIEFWRANPLITILFMASNLLPLFFPAEIDLDKVARALIAITLFQSAYTAEAIRGGLSAVPKGQFEAASALGMGYFHMTVLIVLPQVLKISIPSIVNTFIALFKDTTLVSIIGLLDLFNMSQTVSRSIEWKGYDYETYIFSALIFFICCFGMSQYSQRIEQKLETGYEK